MGWPWTDAVKLSPVDDWRRVSGMMWMGAAVSRSE